LSFETRCAMAPRTNRSAKRDSENSITHVVAWWLKTVPPSADRNLRLKFTIAADPSRRGDVPSGLRFPNSQGQFVKEEKL